MKLSFKSSRLLLCITTLVALGAGVIPMAAQTRALQGIVLDTSGEGIIGAGIIVKGTSIGTVANDLGEFSLNIPAGPAVLDVSGLGYETTTVRVDPGQNYVRIVLTENALMMDEVVVVGYGEQTRRSITSAISKLGGEALQNAPISTLGEGLKGKIAGLRVVQTNNTPGGAFSYTVRGGSSINCR